ncbi:MAG UNVERIFIED_CONTAM: discoidin domain-containing protein, partial [Thermobifida fusca]
LRPPQELVDALADVPRVVPIPMAQVASPPPPPRGTSRISGQLDVAAAASSTPRTSRSSRHRTPQATEGSLTNRILIGAVALLVFVAVVMGAWMLGSSMRDTSGTQTADVPGDKSEETELVVLTPVGATGFDPPPAGDNSEHDDKAPNTIDGDPSTHWNTEGYNSAAFGNYKDGVGLLIDMGTEVEIHEVDITFGSGTYSAELYVRNDAGGAPGEDEKPVWQGAGVTGKVPIKLDEPATGQYVVVWFISPLSQDGGKYRGTINEVELRGIQ